MKYYIQIVAEADAGVVSKDMLSVCPTASFDAIVQAEEACRMVIRSKELHNEVATRMIRTKIDRLRVTLTVVDENGQKVNDHYWYHERKVVKE